jgi:AbrB family looped-hinge helix DNA binding protein
MITVTVSSKYQVVIPREIREKLDIRAGQRIQLIHYQDRIEFIPEKNIKEMKGFLKGLNTDVKREEDRL